MGVYFLALFFYLPSGEASAGVVKQEYTQKSECEEDLARKLMMAKAQFGVAEGECKAMPPRPPKKPAD